jgi:hypothetical protein
VDRLLLGLLLVSACAVPNTNVVFENGYTSIVVYAAFWQVGLAEPLSPGGASDPETVVPASPNTAYALLAPGWSASSTTQPPTSLVALQSLDGFAVHLGDTLTIAVSDATFAGNCASGSMLDQTAADFITQRVFASEFIGLTYDAATCTTTNSP